MQNTVLKPTLKYYIKNGGIVRIILAVIVLGVAAVFLSNAQIAWAIGSVVVILSLIIINFFLRSIKLNGDSLYYFGWFAKRVTVSAKDISQVIHLTQYYEANYGAIQRLLILKPTGEQYFSVSNIYWDKADFEKLLEFFKVNNVKITVDEELSDTPMLVKKYPQALQYYERKPVQTGLIWSGVILVAIVLWYLAFEDPGLLR